MRFTIAGVFIVMLCIPACVLGQLNREKAVATSSITYTDRGFVVKGNPVYVFSGDIDYWRVPRELWRDRLTRIKRSGFNAITFYTYWNLMEPVRGQYHFEDNLDIDAWLSLIEELGMYAIVRAGPYVCAEIDFGGNAPWTVDVPGILYRCSNAQFLQCADTFYAKEFPIIVKHQISRGGCVIAVAIENEYYAPSPDAAYKQHLIDEAYSLGLEVPYIWSLTNNGNEFDPGTFPPGPPPWFASELWTGWIGQYGEFSDSARVDRAVWKILVAGTAGMSLYMIHGGTNFGYTASSDQRITSYDYGAPIGELGQFRTEYWSIKQAAMLAKTFGAVLSSSSNGGLLVGPLPSGLRSWVHTTVTGKIAFVMDTAASPVSFNVKWTDKNITVPATYTETLAPGKFAYFLSDVPVTPNVAIDYSAANVLDMQGLGNDRYLILYGPPAGSGELSLSFSTAPAPPPASPWTWDALVRKARLLFTYPSADSVFEAACDAGNGQTLHLLIMNESMADRTWADSDFIVCGQHYVDENRNIHFPSAGGRAIVYTSAGRTMITGGAAAAPAAKNFSSGWTWTTAAAEAGAAYDDSSWQTSATPQDMTYYGWPNGYGWYRATYTAQQDGAAALSVANVQDEYILFVNGSYVGLNSTQMQLVKGANTIALLAVDYTRDKAFGSYATGPQNMWRSGIFGNVTINGAAVTGWRFKGGFDGVAESPMMGTISPAAWSALLAGQWAPASAAPNDSKPKLWRMDFNYTPPSNALETWTLSAAVTTNSQGVVWVNGHCLGRQITSQPPLFVPQCWLGGMNSIIVLTHDGSAPQGYALTPVEYYSFVKLPATVVKQPPARPVKGACVGRIYSVTGDRFVVPAELKGGRVTVCVYDLGGKKLNTFTGRNVIRVRGKTNRVAGVLVVKIVSVK
ncbi:MAG TPA: beta-galactosidase [Chitinivibrionales bacterium]|nr:beta-galactosidase [Chitinivibrionales bacterium]